MSNALHTPGRDSRPNLNGNIKGVMRELGRFMTSYGNFNISHSALQNGS